MNRTLDRVECRNGVVIYQSRQMIDIGVPHAFSTRIGGVSQPPFDTLNLGNLQSCDWPDTDAHIVTNYQRLQSAIGCKDYERVSVHQVHANRVINVTLDHPISPHEQADALITDVPRQLLSIRTADCIPILLSTDDGRYVAAIHAGWRGIIAGVVPKAIEQLLEAAPCTPHNILAAIGPCIGQEAFEVGSEVAAQFHSSFASDAPIRIGPKGKPHIDLRQAAHLQIAACDIPEDWITISDRCTSRDEDEFFSHRRDHGITGRHATLIATKS